MDMIRLEEAARAADRFVASRGEEVFQPTVVMPSTDKREYQQPRQDISRRPVQKHNTSTPRSSLNDTKPQMNSSTMKSQPRYSQQSVASTQGQPGKKASPKCFLCGELGHIKANCKQKPKLAQLVVASAARDTTTDSSVDPDPDMIPHHRRHTLWVGGRKVVAYRDTGAQLSAIHRAYLDPGLVDDHIKITIRAFRAPPAQLPTARVPVQYKGWKGVWTFAVYDDFECPALLGDDLVFHASQARKVSRQHAMTTRSLSRGQSSLQPEDQPELGLQSLSPATPEGVLPEEVEEPGADSQHSIVGPEIETIHADTSDVGAAAGGSPGRASPCQEDSQPGLMLVPVTPDSALPRGAGESQVGTEQSQVLDNLPEMQKVGAEEENPTTLTPEPARDSTAAETPEDTPAKGTEPGEAAMQRESEASLPLQVEQLVPVQRQQFQENQEADESLQAAWTRAKEEAKSSPTMKGPRFVIVEGLLYRESGPRGSKGGIRAQRQLLVPSKYRAKLLSLAHDHPSGHAGVNRTKDRLGKSFYWEGMGKDVTDYVRSCEVCQRVGKSQDQAKAPLQPLPIIDVPFQRVAVDIMGPFPRKTARGKRYVLTFVDFCTRWPEAIPLGGISAKAVAQALTDIFARLGWPAEILTDAASNFNSKVMQRLLEAHGVRHLTSVPYHHQTNGLVERFNATLGAMIRKFVNEHSNDWDLALQQFLFAYRSVPHPSLGYSPFELVYGHDVKGPLQLVQSQWEGVIPSSETNVVDFVTNLQNTLREAWADAHENLQQAQEKQKTWYDQYARERCFEKGDQVMVLKVIQANKMETSWEGPATVQERIETVNYLIQFPDSRVKPKVYHVNSLKPFYERPNHLLTLSVQEDEEEEWPEGAFYDREGGNLEDVKPSQRLNAIQRKQFFQLTGKFTSLFSPIPGRTTDPQHVVAADDSRPSAEQPRRVSPTGKEAIEREVKEMLDMGIIRPSRSPWASPVVLVPKRGTTDIRFCVDYRKLNSVTRPEHYPMPRLDELLEKLGHAKYLSSLDLT